jgi:hypothetical protein
MKTNLRNSERSPWDFIMFGITFFGFVLALGGTIAASAGVAVTGLFAVILGFLFFGLQHWLAD